MALMFQRLARNFAVNGYFPTDADTTDRILSLLQPCPEGTMRIIDPCAGEGVALAECKHHLGAGRAEAFGVELHKERAWHAKAIAGPKSSTGISRRLPSVSADSDCSGSTRLTAIWSATRRPPAMRTARDGSGWRSCFTTALTGYCSRAASWF